MKKLALLTLLVLLLYNVNGQRLIVNVGYQYIMAKQWDKVIQTYNFSRPFLNKKQPLHINGAQFGIIYLFRSSKKFRHGISLSYAFFKSTSSNTNFQNTLNLYFQNLGYILHYNGSNSFRNLYLDFGVNFSTSALYRRVNKQAFEYNDKKSKAFGIGADLAIKLGYFNRDKSSHLVSPYLSLGYVPFLYSPNTEVVINQTKGFVGERTTSILSFQVGLLFYLKK
jgi:hypothetical protein